MSSHRGDGSVHAPRHGGAASRWGTLWQRALVLVVLASALLAGLATQAPAGGDDLEFARRLTEIGYLDLAERVYEAVLARSWSTSEEQAEARYGLVALGRDRARAALASGASYARVHRLFEAASRALQGFEARDPAGGHARRALLDAGHTGLDFVRWAAGRLADDAPGPVEETARADARAALEDALTYFDRLRAVPGAYQADAAYYRAVGLYYRALVEPTCSEVARAALREAGRALEAFIVEHDGELLAVYAQDVYGVVWRDLARCEDDPAVRHALYAKAADWFTTCISTEDAGPDFLTVIARGYLHLAEVAREASPSASPDLARDALRHLDAMHDHHPALWRTETGIRAMLEHARLVLNMGRTERAFELVGQAIVSADAAGLEAMERAAARALCDVAVGATHTAGEESLGTPTLRRVADELFSIGQYDEALDFYRQVIAGTPCNAEAFLEHRWHAWERIAASYKRLGDRLGEALAYEPIHEAWTRGVIPFEADEASDPNLSRAGNNRRTAQVAFQQVAGVTGSAVFEREVRGISESFRFAYPDHGGPPQGAWNRACHFWKRGLTLKAKGDPHWREKLAAARERFRSVSEMGNSHKQDAAWVYLVRCDYTESDLAAAVETARKALAFWDGPSAKTRASESAAARLRQHVARGAVLYWMARAQHEDGKSIEAAATLDGWHAEYADLDSPYPELGYDLLVQAHLAAGQPDAADAAWRELLRRYPEYRRLGSVAFLLATHHHQRCDPLQARLRPTAAELSEARIRLREAKMEGLRLGSLLAWLEDRLREVEEINRSRRDLGLPEKHEEPRQLSRRIEETKGLLEAWSPRVAESRAEVRRLRAQQAGLEQQLYEPLSRAAGYYLAWDLAAAASGAQDDPARIYALAEMHWQLAQIRPEVTSHWETARRQYERFLALLSVGLRSAGDPEVRTANERLGRIYVHLAQQR